MMLDFMCIGGQRCGTTYLRRCLRRHPDVAVPRDEVHFWDRDDRGDPEQWLALFADERPGRRHGEFTPAYAILPDRTVAEIAAVVPDARLILNVRNPLQRTWSAAMLFADRAQMDPDEPSDAWFIDVARSWRCRAKSTFSRTIETWRAAFGAEQLLLVPHDDLVADPVGVLRDVATHIGVDPAFYAGRASLARRPARMATGGRRVPSAAVLDALRDLHADEVGRLEGILERDLAHWLVWDGTPT